MTLLSVTCTAAAEVFQKSRPHQHCSVANTHARHLRSTNRFPALPLASSSLFLTFLVYIINGINSAARAGSLALQPQPTKSREYAEPHHGQPRSNPP